MIEDDIKMSLDKLERMLDGCISSAATDQRSASGESEFLRNLLLRVTKIQSMVDGSE